MQNNERNFDMDKETLLRIAEGKKRLDEYRAIQEYFRKHRVRMMDKDYTV